MRSRLQIKGYWRGLFSLLWPAYVCAAGRQEPGKRCTPPRVRLTLGCVFISGGSLSRRTRASCSDCQPGFDLKYTWKWPRGAEQCYLKQKIKQNRCDTDCVLHTEGLSSEHTPFSQALVGVISLQTLERTRWMTGNSLRMIWPPKQVAFPKQPRRGWP